jgi:hypothetical protein
VQATHEKDAAEKKYRRKQKQSDKSRENAYRRRD